MRQRLDDAVEAAKKSLRSGESEEIKNALEELSQAYSAAGASLMQEAQAQSDETPPDASDADSATAAGDESVEEADYEIVDEPKS